MKLRKFTTMGLGSLTATVALLAGLSGAHAQGAPGGGSYPGSFLVPGSNTSFSVGGYAKFDYTYDFSQSQGIVGGMSATAIAVDGCATCGPPLVPGGPGTPIAEGAGHAIKGGSQMTASESRFNIQTRTPTGYGEFKTFIEGDFTNPSGLTNSASLSQSSNSTGFRLRQAYGTLGPWLIGQTFSTFNDTNANGEELDFGGDPTAGRVRQPQVRYTYDAGNGLLVMGAVENASMTVEANATAPALFAGTTFGPAGPFGVEQIPDFIGRIEWDQAWGHIAGRAVIHPINFRTAPDNPAGFSGNNSTIGWGLGLGGDYRTWGKDDLTFQVNGGDGGGSYVSGGNNPIPEAIIDATGTLQTINIIDFNVSYAHWWTDTLRTNVAGGYAWITQPGNTPINYASTAIFNGEIKDYYTAHANLIWSPVPQIDTGVEFVFGHRTNEDGLGGDIYRIQASTKFKF